MLGSFKPKTSTGNDNISMMVLKFFSKEIATPLSTLFNKSFSEGTFPNGMKTSKVVPIYKAKDQQQFTNYRPISLLPSISKVLEKAVHKRLYSFLLRNNVLHNNQFGFRPKHSTEIAIAELVSDILLAFERNESTIATFLDLSKAFDTIDHKILTDKLEHYGVRGITGEWFKSYLDDRQQFVQYRGVSSKTKYVSCGVPQGSVLGPLLFIIYINDLPSNITQANTIMYADDTTLYLSGTNNKQLHSIMNTQLDIISDWFKSNKLSVNASKSNFITFSKSLDPNAMTGMIKIDGKQIEEAESVKFLGILIDGRLKWQDHINHCRKKILSGLYALNMCKNVLSTANLRMLYFSLIHPHLQYGNIVWGSAYKYHLNSLKILQKRAIRIISRSTYNAPTTELFKKLNIMKLDDIHHNQLGKLMYGVTKSTLPGPLRSKFTINTDIHDHNTRQQNDLHIPLYKSHIVFLSFLHKGPELWCSLPQSIKSAPSYASFASRLPKHFINMY